MIKNLLLFGAVLSSLISCKNSSKQEADLLVYNANVYTENDSMPKVKAFVVKDGKFQATGDSTELSKKYSFKKVLNAEGKTIVPGLFDDHTHFFRFGLQQQKVDLRGTTSFAEVVSRIVDFQNKKRTDFITGRGWDQNDWANKEFPTKDTLDKLFPDTPVAIGRIDGHALLANQAALDKAGITADTKIEGGEIQKKNGKLTGILIDNPKDVVGNAEPAPTLQEQANALLDAQKVCFSYGLTTVDDAGLEPETIHLMDSLQKEGDLKIRIYAMVITSDKNLKEYLSKGPYKTDRLDVRSFKFYADGALGSRGAALKEPYSDRPGHYGALLSPVKYFEEVAKRVANSDFQLNTHAIGDSANAVVVKTYDRVLKNKENRRWRVEHAQIIDPQDFRYFSKNIIPSVQPTHATSDMDWAETRLGKERMKGAYAYKTLLEQAGVIALGTDFPVEHVSPFYTFYAAVARKNLNHTPSGGFMPEQKLSREETLKGMTIWAAYSNFEEDEKGSIEAGKFADFVILDKDIMTCPEDE
ncbi:MAG: amidohydrolase, partial [Gillisia sp.]